MKNSPCSTKIQHIYIHSLCNSEIYPPETFPWPWKIHHEWRCISYWRWWFSNVMLVFRGVAMFVCRFVLQDSAGVVDPNGSWSHQPRILFFNVFFFPTIHWYPLVSHTIHVWYIYLHEWLFLIENIGINIPYMDPMGLVSCYVFILQVACLLLFLGVVHCHHIYWCTLTHWLKGNQTRPIFFPSHTTHSGFSVAWFETRWGCWGRKMMGETAWLG